MTRAEMIRGFLKYIEDKQPQSPFSSPGDRIYLQVTNIHDPHGDDTYPLDAENTERLISEYLGSLKDGQRKVSS